jgi:hypothetical protein
VSEELENSLQHAIESYLGKRLGAIDEQLARLESDFAEALKSLREISANESLASTPLSAAIFAHLQTARSQRLSGAAQAPAPGSTSLGAIKRAVDEIAKQQSHTDILGSLLIGAAQFAERVALFVVKNDQAIGWRECEAGDPANLEMIGGVSVALGADTMLGRAARSRSSWTGAPGSNSADNLLIDQLGGGPQAAAAVPLVVREKVVAILYADSVSRDSDTLNVDAIEVLCRVAAIAVNLAAASRIAPDKKPEQRETTAPTVVDQPVSSGAPYTPAIESRPASDNVPAAVAEEASAEPEHAAESSFEPVSQEPVAEPTTSVIPEYVPQTLPVYVPDEKAAPETTGVSADEVTGSFPEYVPPSLPDYVPQQAATSRVEETVAQSAPEPVEAETPVAAPAAIETAPIAPGFVAQYAAPLGSARRYGVSEPDLPIEVGEEERRLHNDARRFARLLVSEIKLYNEPKVKEGRNRGDIYDRLREDIDRSRQMYDKRVAPPVAARHDYFHQELVNTLAEGDSAKLGASYPGASVPSN